MADQEFDAMEVVGADGIIDDDEEEEDEDEGMAEAEQEVYLPGQRMEAGEELVYDSSAYRLYHAAQTEASCLSFDIVRDALGDNRQDFPVTVYFVAGTQAASSRPNHILLIKMSQLDRPSEKEEDSDDEEEEDDSEVLPDMAAVRLRHMGCVNRVRTALVAERQLVATWSETGHVHVTDTSAFLRQLDDPFASAAASGSVTARPKRRHKGDGTEQLSAAVVDRTATPLQSFRHQSEGFALDWSPVVKGRLASGDCKHHIHIWEPGEGGSSWHVNQQALSSHRQSVEDLQWSPSEASVLASCSADRTIRVWDVRAKPTKACMITVDNAHSADVNVLSWNRRAPFFVSGGDDGVLKTWDMRQLRSGRAVAEIKHHTAPVTSVEWCPTESTVFASSGADDQTVQWDLSLEADSEATSKTIGGVEVPPSLLFIHQGQRDVKELHWHCQVPGLMITTALEGFNVFRTISV